MIQALGRMAVDSAGIALIMDADREVKPGMQLRCSIEMDAPADTNMATDAAMQDSPVPCLRLYTWNPASITLGTSQKPAILDLDACRHEGIPVVKRFTGGAAVLHKDDLTYAFFWPAAAEPAYKPIDLRRKFQDVFLASFADFGITARPCANARWRMPASAICFHGQAASEITIDGRKVAGNAQRITRRGIFQHGSILFRDHEALFCRLVRGAAASGSMTGINAHAPNATPVKLAERMAHHVARVFALDT